MKILLVVSMACLATLAIGQPKCLDPEEAVKLDAQWENANLTADAEFIASLLAEDFIWVHNHAGTIDSKQDAIDRATRNKARNNQNTRSRKQRDVKALILGSTAVVTGYTVVDRGPTPTTYNFMRTYTAVGGKCYLLANHTMAVPEEGQ